MSIVGVYVSYVTVRGWYWRVSFVDNEQGYKVMFLTNANKNHESFSKNNREYDEVELRYFMKNIFYLLIFNLQLVFELLCFFFFYSH